MDNELIIRLGFFFGVFAIMAGWELISPRRKLMNSKLIRWYSNLGIVLLNSVILRFIFPAAAVGMAITAQERGWGLMNNFEIPLAGSVVAAVVFMDLAIYLQHVLFHSAPALWRVHRTHHTDLDYDVTTGARFHPIEIVLSMLIKFSVVVTIGAPPVAVLIFEVVLNATAMFNHSNVYIPKSIDAFIRLFIVTPDMHRVHHSVEENETNSNFGFNLSVWDRLFGTYLAQPSKGHVDMEIGIHKFRDPEYLHLGRMILIPFIGDAGDYAINRRNY